MTTRPWRRLAWAGLVLPSTLAAAELPVVAVTIGPDGALVERAGTLPAGDSTVTGLPAALDGATLAVAVDGVARPAWRLRVDAPPPATVPDALRDERAAALAAAVAAEAALDRARERVRLAEAVLADPPADPARAVPPPPTPADQTALAAFVAANRTQAAREEQEAVAAREKAAARLADVDARIAALRPRAEARARLELDGADGRAVRVVYRVREARWAPAYRLEVAQGAATLVQLARVEPGGADRWDGAPIALTTRAASRDPVLPPLAIPQLGVGDAIADIAWPRARWMAEVEGGTLQEVLEREEAVAASEMGGHGAFMAIGAGGGASGMFGQRSGGGRKRAVARFGGSAESESAVATVSNPLRQEQRSDGTWGEAPYVGETTALVALMFMGSGYDHRMPSKYRPMMQKAIPALLARPMAEMALPELTLVTNALAEAYAMSNDPALKPAVEERIRLLRQRAFAAGEAAAWIGRGQAFAGPEILTWLTVALKSAAMAGIDIGDGLDQVRLVLPLAERHADAEEARLSAVVVDVFTGRRPAIEPVEAQRMAARAETWLARGRTELVLLGSYACFQVGGTVWSTWNGHVRDLLVARQGPDRSWHTRHPAGRLAGDMMLSMCLQIYYRYLDPAAGRAATPAGLPDAAVAAQGWPVRWTLPPLALTAGARTTVEVARVPLPGALRWSAIPVLEPTVWRSLPTRNPLAQPLPAAPCALVYEGVPLGTWTLPFTTPGGTLTIPLAAEPMARVERTATSVSDDGMRSRTLEVTITLALQAPAEWKHPVAVVEPLPRGGADIDVVLRQPDLSGKALKERMELDPFWRGDLLPGTPATAAWRLKYPAVLRPFLEAE